MTDDPFEWLKHQFDNPTPEPTKFEDVSDVDCYRLNKNEWNEYDWNCNILMKDNVDINVKVTHATFDDTETYVDNDTSGASYPKYSGYCEINDKKLHCMNKSSRKNK